MPATAESFNDCPRALRNRGRVSPFVLLSLLLCLHRGAISNTATPEYQVKAAFLFNFTQFVEWPPRELPTPGSPLAICVLGEDPFGTVLDNTVRGESANGHPLVVRCYRALREVDSCHVLFISRSEAGRLREILTGLKGRSVLTVGDVNDFASSGGCIGFVTVSNKIRLRISLTAARAAGLTLSSNLLRPAEVIDSGGS